MEISNPSDAQYRPTIQVTGEGGGGAITTTGVPVSHDGGIPFTGMDAGILVIVAIAMFATGTVLNRLSRQRRAKS